MKNVLVVGGAGYIGGATVDQLLIAGNNVTVYDNLSYESRFLKPVNFIFGDIRDTRKLIQVSSDFDVIVLMAALVGDPACSVDPQLTATINFHSIKNFCNSISKDKHVIFMSTCSVYGAQDRVLDEESKTNPLSSYASTKLAAEKYITDMGGTIFRLGTVFGRGDNFSRLRMDLVVNVLTMKAFFEKRITINGGEQWRPIISVIDIANYISETIKFNIRGTYVLSLENVTIRDLGLKIAKLIPDTEINYIEAPFQDTRNYRVSNKKSFADFKYRPHITVEHEVLRFIKLFHEKRIENPFDTNYHNGAFLEKFKNKFNILSV